MELRHRYLKGVDITQTSQLPDIEFDTLDTAFKDWFNGLSPTQHLTNKTIYIRKDSNQLGALFLLHVAYHLSICDLHRIGDPRLMPSLFRLHFSIDSLPAQRPFLRHCRKTCFEHAKRVATILAQAARHGTRMLADSWLCTAAYETIRIMLFYITRDNNGHIAINLNTEAETLKEVCSMINSNLTVLYLMKPLFTTTAERCVSRILRLVLKEFLS